MSAVDDPGIVSQENETETLADGDDTGVDLRSIEFGETAEGQLDSGDPESSENRGRHEPVTFQGEAGQVVTITMTADQGDTYLILRGPDSEEIARNDDNFEVEGSLNSRIADVELPADGQYTIVATSFNDMATFEYELTLERSESENGGEQTETETPADGNDTGVDLRSIELGQTAEGQLEAGDPESSENRGSYEPVTFRGEAGQRVTIEMASDDGDTYLILRGPDGEEIARDDDDGAGLNSRISDVELPSNGEYTIIATSFWEGSTFDYTLSLSSGSSGGTDTGDADYFDVTVPSVEATAGGTAEVTYEVANTGEEPQALVLRSGLSDLPSGWEVSGHSDDGGTWRGSDRTWLFQELSTQSDVSPTATLQVPEDVEAGETFTFRASVLRQEGSEAANTTYPVRITIRETTLATTIDQNDNGRIDDLEILEAIELWQNQEEVPGYGGTISDLQILDLIDMWQEDEQIGGS